MSHGGDLSDVAVVAHVLQNRLAAITGAADLLRRGGAVPDDMRDELLDIVSRAAEGIRPAIQMLQYGMPAAALLELQPGSGALPKASSGVDRAFPVPDDDAARVEALQRFRVLDEPLLPELERITRLAASAASASGAFVNLIDADRQWAAAATGGDRVEVPRCDAMCNVTLVEKMPIVVADASTDPVFGDSPWVTGVLGEVRLYASVPLLTSGDHAIGTLCVVDDSPRTLTPEEIGALSDLASLAVAVLEARLAGLELRRMVEAAAG